MAMSLAIYILSLLLCQLLPGDASQQEPIRIFYGTHNKREIQNETNLTVNPLELQRLHFVANKSIVIDMSSDRTNITTSFHESYNDGNKTAVIYTHFLELTRSGSITIHGLLKESTNTDYHVIIYFNVLREELTVATTTTAAMEDITSTVTEGDTTTTTQGGNTISTPTVDSEVASATGKIQIYRNTLITVVIVVVFVTLAACSIVVAAVVIYYRKRLKDLKQQQRQDAETSMTHMTQITRVDS